MNNFQHNSDTEDNAMKHYRLSMSQLNLIVTEEMRRGKTETELIDYLRERGWTQERALQFVRKTAISEALLNQEIETREAPQQTKKRSRLVFLWLCAGAGLLIVLTGYAGQMFLR